MPAITRRRAGRLSAAAALILILTVVVAPATGAPDPQLLPDLVAEPVGSPDSTAGTDTVGDETRLLLRFAGYIRNEGPGPLHVTGVEPANEQISGDRLRQVITGLGAEPMPGAELRYETTDLHNHWHFQKAARYSLWNEAKTNETGASNKVGFCFLDIEGYGGEADPGAFTDDCRQREPSFTGQLDMGISRGWRDVYQKTLPFQYVDVSNTTPGRYWLRSEVDPENLIREHNEQNTGAFANISSTVPGHVAKPAAGVPVSGSGSPVPLSADTFGAPGAVRFKITQAPQHGQLATPPADGEGWFAGSQVTYQASGAYNGCDSFKFAAKQAGSQFPISPASAAVTLSVGTGNCAGTVAISGAPDFLFTGEGTQLGVSAPSDVTWKVNDVVGGNSTLGTITAGGFYKAPAAPPAGGKVRISAVAASGAYDDVEIAIRTRPQSGATPDVPSPAVPSAKRKPLSKPVIGRNGRLLVVKLTPGKTGRLKVNVNRVKKGKRVRIGACKVRVLRARPATCRFRLRKANVPRLRGKIAVDATLTVKGRKVARRRAKVSLVKKPNARYIGPVCILTP